MMREMADRLVKEDKGRIVTLWNKQNEIICIAGEDSGKSAIKHLREATKGKEFVGGGSERYAEGKVK